MGRGFLIILNIFFFLLILLVYSCSSSLPRVDVVEKNLKHPCRIIILPFMNQTDNPCVARLLYRILFSELVESKMFQVVPEGTVRRFMTMERWFIGQPFSPDMTKILAKKTGADAIISGEVIQVVDEGEKIQLAFNIWVKDIQNGKLLWNTYHRRSGEDYRKALHFGRIYTLTGLAKHMVDEVIKSWQKRGLGGCRESAK